MTSIVVGRRHVGMSSARVLLLTAAVLLLVTACQGTAGVSPTATAVAVGHVCPKATVLDTAFGEMNQEAVSNSPDASHLECRYKNTTAAGITFIGYILNATLSGYQQVLSNARNASSTGSGAIQEVSGLGEAAFVTPSLGSIAVLDGTVIISVIDGSPRTAPQLENLARSLL